MCIVYIGEKVIFINKIGTKIMLKKLTSLLGIIVFCIVCSQSMTVFAETDDSVEYTYEVLNNNTIMITGYTGSGENIIVLSSIDGYIVIQIGCRAFESYAGFASVTIPNNIVVITSI